METITTGISMNRNLALVFVVLCQASFAASKYYAIVFGVQDALNTFTHAHTFAAFVETQADADSAPTIVDKAVISWLPATGKVHLFAAPEEGLNYSLERSLREPTEDGRKLSAWGPYEIHRELFLRAKRQALSLDNNEILYQAIEGKNRKAGISSNCEHTVSDIDTDHGLLSTGTGHGNRGSYLVTRHLSRWFLNLLPEPAIAKALGLNAYPIHFKSLK